MRVPAPIARSSRAHAWLLPLALLAASPAAAQQSPVVSAAELDAALSDQAAAVAADRAAVQATLARPQVAEVARSVGVDIEEGRPAASSLSGEALASAVTASRRVEQALAGGQMISINATTLIIVLLLVILLVIIAD